MSSINLITRRALILTIVALFLATTTQAYHTGIGGDPEGKGNVALAGCTCHAEEPDNSVTVVLDQQNTEPGTDPIANLKQTKTTDASGKAEFVYKYEAILNVTVSKTSGNDTYEGSGIIRLLIGKTEQVTVEAVLVP